MYIVIFKAMWKNGAVAVKKFEGNCPRQQRSEFEKEMEILSRVNHENVLKLFGFNSERGNTYLVIELMKGGSLYDYIRESNNRENGVVKINWHKDFELVKQIVAGMAYLHEQRVLHLDLKSQNVLLNSDKTKAKISDFGMSHISNMTTMMTTKTTSTKSAKGTIRYMAPEVSNGHAGTFKSDVWSFGCILLEICTRHIPFHALLDSAVLPMLQNENALVPINMSKMTPRVISVLIYKCLSRGASERPTFVEIDRITKDVNSGDLIDALATIDMNTSRDASKEENLKSTTDLKKLLENKKSTLETDDLIK